MHAHHYPAARTRLHASIAHALFISRLLDGTDPRVTSKGISETPLHRSMTSNSGDTARALKGTKSQSAKPKNAKITGFFKERPLTPPSQSSSSIASGSAAAASSSSRPSSSSSAAVTSGASRCAGRGCAQSCCSSTRAPVAGPSSSFPRYTSPSTGRTRPLLPRDIAIGGRHTAATSALAIVACLIPDSVSLRIALSGRPASTALASKHALDDTSKDE